MREGREAFFELLRVEDPRQEKTKKVFDLLIAVRPEAGEEHEAFFDPVIRIEEI